MAEAPDPLVLTQRKVWRKTILYLDSDPDVVTVLSALGFQQVKQLTPAETQAAQALAAIANGLSGANSAKNVPVGVMRAVDGRLAITYPSQPRAVAIELAPAAKMPVLFTPGHN